MTPNSTQIAAVSLLLAAVCAQAATPLEQMNAALTEWVGVQNGVPASSVTVVPPDARVAVQPCASTYVFDYPFVSRDSVRVRCTKPNWQLFMKVGLVSGSAPATLTPGASAAKAAPAPEFRQVVVAATNLPAGQVLQRDSLKLDRMEADKISKAHYLENQGLEGQELLRAVRAGEPIRVSDLRPATLVKRGEMVLMTIGSPATFEISVKAEAMQDGRVGEQIKLRNTESGRTLSGVVTGKGTAKGL
ncbi:MAG: flagellar basal body P-ring formation chaperone FlgA [Burkholderiales bacterium]|nr:flagellar basal body P-ring formation chaperone FlgA [Burkholderiales bacterium]